MINLTIESMSNQTIEILEIGINNKFIVNNSESLSTNYSNYILNIHPSYTSFKLQNIFDIMKSVNNNEYLFFVCLLILIGFFYLLYNLSKKVLT